jgi:hypothetical protein
MLMPLILPLLFPGFCFLLIPSFSVSQMLSMTHFLEIGSMFLQPFALTFFVWHLATPIVVFEVTKYKPFPYQGQAFL